MSVGLDDGAWGAGGLQPDTPKDEGTRDQATPDADRPPRRPGSGT